MPELPKPLPRFLPTLTEVVDPSVLAASSDALASESEIEKSALADQITALLEPRAAQLVNALLSEHMLALETRLYAEMSRLVRESVAEAFAPKQPHNGFHPIGKVPNSE